MAQVAPMFVLAFASIGVLLLILGARLRRRAGARSRPQAVFLGELPSGPVLVSGRAVALAPSRSPATGRACVYWQLRLRAPQVLADMLDENSDGPEDRLQQTSDGAGVFLLDDGNGRALVWLGWETRFAGGWHENLTGDVTGTRDVAERLIAEGATVSVSGRPTGYDAMMTGMADRAVGLESELLKALQTKPDLRGLPCFWPNGPDFAAAECPPQELLEDLRTEGFVELYGGAFLLFMAALLAFALLRGLV